MRNTHEQDSTNLCGFNSASSFGSLGGLTSAYDKASSARKLTSEQIADELVATVEHGGNDIVCKTKKSIQSVRTTTANLSRLVSMNPKEE
jgi:hypothetical protein